MSRIETTLKAYGWTESFIGIWENKQFNHLFDINSGGIAVLDLDCVMTDYLSEEIREYEQMKFISKYNHVNLRADLPF